jgi:hypothetical protein
MSTRAHTQETVIHSKNVQARGEQSVCQTVDSLAIWYLHAVPAGYATDDMPGFISTANNAGKYYDKTMMA